MKSINTTCILRKIYTQHSVKLVETEFLLLNL